MVRELGHHHMGQQSCGRDTFIDDVCWNRRLGQGFTTSAHPLSAYMLLNREYTRRVVELFADSFTDALKLAATRALGVVGLMVDNCTWKLWRQWCALRFLAWLFRGGIGVKCIQLRLDSLKVDVEQVIEQAALLWADLFAALGVLMAFENGDLVRELLDDDLVVLELATHRLDLRLQCQRLFKQRTQLCWGQFVEVRVKKSCRQ